MCEKGQKTVIRVIATLLILIQAGAAWSATHWIGADGQWSIPENWDNGLPMRYTDAYIDKISNGKDGPVISPGPLAQAFVLRGPSCSPDDNSVLYIVGGNLYIDHNWLICDEGGTGAVIMQAGTVNVRNTIYLPFGAAGKATFDMFGGSIATSVLQINADGVLTLNGEDASVLTEGLHVTGGLNLYGGYLIVKGSQFYLGGGARLEITSALGTAGDAGGTLIVYGNQVEASWLGEIAFSKDPGDLSGIKNVVYDGVTTTITSSVSLPAPDPDRRAVLNGFILALTDAEINRPAEVLKVDIGCVDQFVAPGFEQWSLSDVQGGCTSFYSESSGPPTFVRHLGENITFVITAFLVNDCGFRNRYNEIGAGTGIGGVLGGDMVLPVNGYEETGGMILTIKGLPADKYKLVTYHNDPLNQTPRCRLKAEVSGAVLEWQGDYDVRQSAATNDGDDFWSLDHSLVTFTATGFGDVIVTYSPTGKLGQYPEDRLKVAINGFQLFKQWATELLEP